MTRRLATQGVRALTLDDIAPQAEIVISGSAYTLENLVKDSLVLDVGSGFGRHRTTVEQHGGTWVGLERFPASSASVLADAEALPFRSNAFDVAIMDAVLEHIPDVGNAFREVSRVLKPGGLLVGYAAFMECFHEISYSHLSFKALEHYGNINGLALKRLGGGNSFGIDYHLHVLLYPIPTKLLRKTIASMMRFTFRTKSYLAGAVLGVRRGLSKQERKKLERLYYEIECLRQSNGFSFLMEKSSP